MNKVTSYQKQFSFTFIMDSILFIPLPSISCFLVADLGDKLGIPPFYEMSPQMFRQYHGSWIFRWSVSTCNSPDCSMRYSRTVGQDVLATVKLTIWEDGLQIWDQIWYSTPPITTNGELFPDKFCLLTARYGAIFNKRKVQVVYSPPLSLPPFHSLFPFHTRIYLVYSPEPTHVVEIYFIRDIIDSDSLLVLAAELGRYAMKVDFNETLHTQRGWAIIAREYHRLVWKKKTWQRVVEFSKLKETSII